MKAIHVNEFGDESVLRLVDAPEPVPLADQVVVEMRAIGVNPVDTYIRAGIYGPRAFPWLPGFDGAGVVHAVGKSVSDIRPGQRVYVFSGGGTYAQKIAVPAIRAYPMPERITFPQAACVGVPGATAWRALFQKANARPGQSVLIHGATGGVGSAAVQLARAAGLQVVGTGGSEEGLKRIRDLGCHHALNHHQAGYMTKIEEITSGRGVDLVLEMLANVNLQADLDAAARFGTIVIIGNRGTIEIDPRLTMGKELTVRGMALFNATDAELREVNAGLYAAMENGAYTPIVAEELPLAQAAEAHRRVMAAHHPGSIVLIP